MKFATLKRDDDVHFHKEGVSETRLTLPPEATRNWEKYVK